MTAAPIPSLDLVRRTLAADIAYTISRMQVLERIRAAPAVHAREVDAGDVVGGRSSPIGFRPCDWLCLTFVTSWPRAVDGGMMASNFGD